MTAAAHFALVWIFWACAAGIAYSYVGYPLLLKYGARLLPGGTPHDPDPMGALPSVTVIFAAFNEEKVIAEKLSSLVASEFPEGMLEVLVGDDASTDATAAIVRTFAAAHPFIRLIPFAGRVGKPRSVNALAAQSRGSVLVLTDANIIFDADALRRLARWFADPKVGLVAANIVTRHLAGLGGIAMQEDAYIRRELQMKRQQCILSQVVIAPFGACYAIRNEDYRPVPDGYTVDDFFISMRPQIEGRRSVQDMDAICREDASEHASTEFRRKARISRGNFQNLSSFYSVALRPWSPLGFHFISHKVLRWMGPGLILLSYAACGLLAAFDTLYAFIFAGMLIVLLSPVIDSGLERVGVRIRGIRFASYFLQMNLAVAFGFLLWLSGKKGGVWKPSRGA